MSVRPENDYRKDESLHDKFKLKVIKSEEEIAIHKDKIYKELEKKKHKKLTSHLHLYQKYRIRKTMDTLFKLNKSRSTKYPE